jgi:hypothetical protein
MFFSLGFLFCGYDLEKAVGVARKKPITGGKLLNLMLKIRIGSIILFFNY